MGKNKIPDRWQAYSMFGKPIAKTRFMALKVPLNERIGSNLEESERCTPETMLSRMKEAGMRLGLLIDLTNTNRYYSHQAITTYGIEHKKIMTEGHVVPSKDVCSRFRRTVEDFLDKNKDNDLLIGVHCTHGVNRTGYLICRYMVETMKFDPEESIKSFNDARGHEIERENYLDHLLSRLWETEVESPPRERYSNRDRHHGGGVSYNNRRTERDIHTWRDGASYQPYDHRGGSDGNRRTERGYENDSRTRFDDRRNDSRTRFDDRRNDSRTRFDDRRNDSRTRFDDRRNDFASPYDRCAHFGPGNHGYGGDPRIWNNGYDNHYNLGAPWNNGYDYYNSGNPWNNGYGHMNGYDAPRNNGYVRDSGSVRQRNNSNHSNSSHSDHRRSRSPKEGDKR